MAERGQSVDHSTVHRWVVRYAPPLLERFNRRKQSVTGGDGAWTRRTSRSAANGCIPPAPSPASATRSHSISAKAVTCRQPDAPLRRALACHGRPHRTVIDGSQTNHEAILSCDAESSLRDRSRRLSKPISVCKSQDLNNRIEQDHRRIKRRIRSMLGFKSKATAAIILPGIEMIHIIRKRQAKYAYNRSLGMPNLLGGRVDFGLGGQGPYSFVNSRVETQRGV